MILQALVSILVNNGFD